MLIRLMDKLLRIPEVKYDPDRERLKPDPPPWDVPLDQTTPKIHIEGIGEVDPR